MRSDHLAKHVKTHKNGDGGGSESIKKGGVVKKGEDFGRQQQQHHLGGFGEYTYVHGMGISEQ